LLRESAAEGLCMLRRLCSRFIVTAVFVAGLAQNAAAHPHVWVSARAQVIFDAKGEIEAIRHAWTFDEMYSAFVTEGQGKDGQLMTKEELAPLAKTNVESLAEFAVIDVAEQCIERSIVRPCGVNPGRKCRYAEKALQHSAAAKPRLLRTRSAMGSSHWTRVCASIAAEISQHP